MSLRLLIPAAAKALRDAEDGLTLQELGARIGTRWPDRVVRGMQRDGFVVGEENGRLSLVVDVERTASNTPDPPANTLHDGVGAASIPNAGGKAPGVSGGAGLIARASASGSLSTDVDDGRGSGQASLSPGWEAPAAVVNADTLFEAVPEGPASPYEYEDAA